MNAVKLQLHSTHTPSLHANTQGLRYSSKDEIQMDTHTESLDGVPAWGQTAAAAEASHHLIYNITDTWQIPQHYVSMHKSTAPLSHFVSSSSWRRHTAQHTYSSNSISRQPDTHILSAFCEQTRLHVPNISPSEEQGGG